MTIKFLECAVFNQMIEAHGDGQEIQAGSFFTVNDSGVIIGMDNTTNDCWVEAFNNTVDCFEWLQGEGADNLEGWINE